MTIIWKHGMYIRRFIYKYTNKLFTIIIIIAETILRTYTYINVGIA